MGLAALTLLHVLVFVYWLGGDLGAFYASRFLVDPSRPVAARTLAGRILNDIDMAPRTALILMLPTGLTLAAAKGWAAVPGVLLAAVWALSLAWLAAAWAVHLSHPAAGAPVRLFDTGVRWLALAGLAGAGVVALLGRLELPAFVALKLLLLAAAVALGLAIRVVLKPFGPAYVQLLTCGPTPDGDAAIARAIARARPMVLLIWAVLLTAAFLGLWQPI